MTLVAELALALAGFAGVSAAFGGRDRSYVLIEATRLRGLFAHAFLALATSLLVLSLLSFGLESKTTYFWSSVLGALCQAPAACYFSFHVYRYAVDPNASTGLWALVITVGARNLSLMLLTMSVVVGGSIGLLVSALSVQLLFGVWVFTRLLIHRN